MAAVPPFAMHPSMTNAPGAVIDYSTKEAQSNYRSAVACLYTDKTNCYNMHASTLPGFLNHLHKRANESNWWPLLKVRADYEDDDSPPISILKSYGTLSLDYLKDYIEVMHAEDGRWQQDNFQCQQCIFNSLSEEALSTVNLHEAEYVVDILNEQGDFIPQIQALLLIKIIIRESRVDTPARTRVIRGALSDLNKAIADHGYDIGKFNAYVLGLLADLTAQGEVTHDLLTNLFKAYLTAPDERFVAYITQKESDYDEGTPTDDKTLMTQALTKYMGLVDNGTWTAQTADHVQLLALAARVDNLIPRAPRASSSGKKRSNDTEGKASKKYKPSEWQKVEPTALEAQSNCKKVNGKEYKWCSNHKIWCAHSTSECRGVGNTNNECTTKKAPPAKTDNDEKKSSMISAFNSIAMEQEDSSDEDN